MLNNRRIIPILLLKNGTLHKGVRFKNHNYVGDPINTLRIFNEKEADEIILLDVSLDRREKGPNFSLLADIAGEIFSPISYGGGITNLGQAEKVLSLGFEKISLCTSTYENPHFVKECVKEYGAQAVIGGIDIGKGFLHGKFPYIRSGKRKINTSIQSYVRYVNDLGVGEILVTDMSREGTFLGYDTKFFQEIAEISLCPVIANGGARSLDDIEMLFRDTEVSAAGVGSLFVYHGNKKAVLITYPEQKK